MSLTSQELRLNGATQVIFIVGDPVAQTIAPAGLTPRLQSLGADVIVVPAHVSTPFFPDFVRAVERMDNVDGLIVTVPHKFAAHALCAECDAVATRVGSVNLMRRRPQGGWYGAMTDGHGCVMGIRGKGFEPAGKRALVIGAGGAGVAVADALCDAGVDSVAVHDIDPARAKQCIARMAGSPMVSHASGLVDARGYDLVVNATLQGTAAGDPLPFDPKSLGPATFIADLACGPNGSTALIDAAIAVGCATMSGAEMFEAVADRLVDFFVHKATAARGTNRSDVGSDGDDTAAVHLRRLLDGYQATQAIHAAAVLGVADVLSDTPVEIDAIAEKVHAHPGTLYRLLRALAALGVFREHVGRRFTLTPMGAWIRSDASPSMRPWAMFVGEPMRWRAWGHLVHSVRSGKDAFPEVHGVDTWTHRRWHPEEAALFQAAMTANSQRIDRAVVAACDLGNARHLGDIGGGSGSLLAAFLSHNRELRGTLFDLPHVVSDAAPILEAAGVRQRCRIVAGDMFDSVPEGCDALVMKFVLHDWDDRSAERILSVCRRALERGKRLFVVEYLIAPPNEGLHAKMSDLNMLLGPGGRERTKAEYAAILVAAGFHTVDTIPTNARVSILVGEAS